MAGKTLAEIQAWQYHGSIPTAQDFRDWADSQVLKTPGKDGSAAIGDDAEVTGEQALQVGAGANSVDNSLKVGGNLVGPGVLLLGGEPTEPSTMPDGSIWVDSFGIVCVKTGGRIIKL